MLLRTRQHVESERKLGEYFFLDTLNPGFQRVFKPFLRVFKVFPHSKGFQSVSKFQKLVQIFWETNRFILVVGIRATFTCFQHLRPRNRGFLHETGNSLDFDYLESRQKRWYTYISTYIQTYIHPNLWNKAGIDAGDPGWSRTRPKLVCCEVWWLRSNNFFFFMSRGSDLRLAVWMDVYC